MSDNEQTVTSEKGKCFILRVSTGCTCCSNENFIEGVWRTREAADKRAEHHRERRTLASQYARDGNQSVAEVDYELAGTWIILDGRYVVAGGFVEDGDEGQWPETLHEYR